MYVNTHPNDTIFYFYGRDLSNLTKYEGNPVINKTRGATVAPLDIDTSGNKKTLYVAGHIIGEKWQGWKYTSTDWTSWSKPAGNPVLKIDSSKKTATLVNPAPGAAYLEVHNNSMFTAGDPIVIGDKSSTEVNRILSLGGNVGMDSHVKLMLKFNGLNGSHTFIDSSPDVKTITAKGTAQISTEQSKFEGSSGSFDGNGYLTIPHHRDFDLGKNNFTIDFWIRFSSLPSIGYDQFIWFEFDHNERYNSISVSNISETYKWRFESKNYDTVIVVDESSPGLSINTWYHIAIVRTGKTFKIFQDGKQCGTAVSNSGAVASIIGDVKIGYHNSPNYFFKGNLDEFRFSKGIARWTSDFTPPSSAYSYKKLNLYYPIDNAYTNAMVCGYQGGSLYWGEVSENRSINTSFQMVEGLLETTSYWDYTGGSWVYRPLKTPPLPLGKYGSWCSTSSENLRLIEKPDLSQAEYHH